MDGRIIYRANKEKRKEIDMKRFEIEYYGRGCYVNRTVILAKTKTDALLKLHDSGEKVVEIICVRNLDFPD
jgi:hypothetical protein